jgi:acyl dehydratase
LILPDLGAYGMSLVRYAEDYFAGQKFKIGKRVVSESEIIAFAKKYDPFPFHVDAQAAKETVFGGLISSGWMTALIWLGMMHDSFLSYETVLGSPGHEELTWPNPVRPGDELKGEAEIIESRISKSKPELGFIRYKATLKNQKNETVFVTVSTLMVKTKQGS